MMNWEDQLTGTKLIPVIVLDDARVASGVADALLAGGLKVAEVTLRTEAGVEAIRAMSQDTPIIVGAGTVLTSEQVDVAVDAGARFIVSPGLSRPVIVRAQELGVPVLPGVATPTGVMDALGLGLELLKFFPASCYGGPDAIRSLAAVFARVRFVPTGGVNEENLASYCRLPNVAAVGGSWMVDRDLIRERDFDRITRLCCNAVTLVHAARKVTP